jgi:hypothetical protein
MHAAPHTLQLKHKHTITIQTHHAQWLHQITHAPPPSTQHERQIAITLSIAHIQPAVRRRPKHVIEKESWVEQGAQRDDVGGVVNNR